MSAAVNTAVGVLGTVSITIPVLDTGHHTQTQWIADFTLTTARWTDASTPIASTFTTSTRWQASIVDTGASYAELTRVASIVASPTVLVVRGNIYTGGAALHQSFRANAAAARAELVSSASCRAVTTIVGVGLNIDAKTVAVDEAGETTTETRLVAGHSIAASSAGYPADRIWTALSSEAVWLALTVRWTACSILGGRAIAITTDRGAVFGAGFRALIMRAERIAADRWAVLRTVLGSLILAAITVAAD